MRGAYTRFYFRKNKYFSGEKTHQEHWQPAKSVAIGKNDRDSKKMQ